MDVIIITQFSIWKHSIIEINEVNQWPDIKALYRRNISDMLYFFQEIPDTETKVVPVHQLFFLSVYTDLSEL